MSQDDLPLEGSTMSHETVRYCMMFNQAVENQSEFVDFMIFLGEGNEYLESRFDLIVDRDPEGKVVIDRAGRAVRKSMPSDESVVALADLYCRMAQAYAVDGNSEYVETMKALAPDNLVRRVDDVPASYTGIHNVLDS